MTSNQAEIYEYNQKILLRIRELCAHRKTSITKIEKALGYGNGTVSGWKNAKKRAPHDRVVEIAKFLNVPVMALTGGLENEEKPAPRGNELSKKDQLLNLIDSMDRAELIEALKAVTKKLEEV